jgi:hypothetical protein
MVINLPITARMVGFVIYTLVNVNVFPTIGQVHRYVRKPNVKHISNVMGQALIHVTCPQTPACANPLTMVTNVSITRRVKNLQPLVKTVVCRFGIQVLVQRIVAVQEIGAVPTVLAVLLNAKMGVVQIVNATLVCAQLAHRNKFFPDNIANLFQVLVPLPLPPFQLL